MISYSSSSITITGFLVLLILGSTFSVIFYFSSSNQQQPQALAQLKSRTYENPGYGYSIQYPANWMEVES